MKVSVIGLGKAGLPLAAVMADAGIQVVGVDVDPDRVADINSGKNPIPEEPGLSELIRKHSGTMLTATTSYAEASEKCNAFIVIVPLFIDNEKTPDFSIIESVLKSIADVLKEGDLVILETTVPPGSSEKICKPILDKAGRKYYFAYSPERIMTGYSISRYRDFPKVVGGIDEESGKKAFELYSGFCKNVSLVSNAMTAEMVKVAEGVYRDVNIALANELFMVSEKSGVDYNEVRKHANHDFCHLHSQGNVGGHCIPVYPWFLINNFDTPLIKNARELNDSMIKYYADRLKSKKGRIAVLGLTYRDNVKETAYTRSFPMIKLLESRGYDVYANDPLFTKEEIIGMGFSYTDDFEEMDGIILMNNCPEYRSRLIKIKEIVVDTKGGL